MIRKKILVTRATGLAVVVFVSSLTASLVVWAIVRNPGPAYSIPTTQTTNYVERLEELRQKYAAIKSVHIVADAQIILYGQNFRVGAGSYEYWAEGDRYKIKCHSDKHLGLLPDVDLAYDGSRFYHLDRASGILSYQRHDISKTFGALPNPLFMPVNFLSIEDDDCPFCALRLGDLKSANTRWYERASRLEAKAQAKDQITGQSLTEVEMPGGTKAKRQFKIRMRMAGASEGEGRATLIDQVGLDGKLLSSTTFDNFQPTAMGEFPRAMKLEVFDEKSNILIQMVYSVKTLEIDQPLEKSVFAISFDEAETVWDSDDRKFAKENRPKPKAP